MFSIIINAGYYKNLALDTVDFRVSKINLLFASNIYITFFFIIINVKYYSNLGVVKC